MSVARRTSLTQLFRQKAHLGAPFSLGLLPSGHRGDYREHALILVAGHRNCALAHPYFNATSVALADRLKVRPSAEPI